MAGQKAQAFRSLHVKGAPLVLYNIWDAGSARTVERAGAKALATGSWSVAAAQGFEDGERLPLDLALANLRRIVAAVALPVSIDLEGGYGAAPPEIASSVKRAAEAGAVGCNLEDGIVGGEGHYSIADQSARLSAARGAVGDAMFINARVDLFLDAKPEAHDAALLDAAIERAMAYVDAGADAIFVPGLIDEAMIGRLCAACPKPVNILASPEAPPANRLTTLGVARISYGAGPYRKVMVELESAARAAFDH